MGLQWFFFIARLVVIFFYVAFIFLFIGLIVHFWFTYKQFNFVLNYELTCNPKLEVFGFKLFELFCKSSAIVVPIALTSYVAADSILINYCDYHLQESIGQLQRGEISWQSFNSEFHEK